MGSWSGYTRALSEPVRGWVTSGSGISQREDTELIEMNQESGTDVVRKGEEDNGTLHYHTATKIVTPFDDNVYAVQHS